jgi:hypothetical protein
MPTTFDWNPQSPPLSFTYDGRPFARLLQDWTHEDLPADGGTQVHRYADPESGLSVSA